MDEIFRQIIESGWCLHVRQLDNGLYRVVLSENITIGIASATIIDSDFDYLMSKILERWKELTKYEANVTAQTHSPKLENVEV